MGIVGAGSAGLLRLLLLVGVIGCLASPVAADQSPDLGATKGEPQRSPMTEFLSDEIGPSLLAKLTSLDARRIKRFDESRQAARREAGAGEARLLAVLAELMDAPPLGIEPKVIAGTWHCRRFNLGGEVSPLRVGASFDCKIYRHGSDYIFAQVSGAQLMLGKLERVDEHRLMYYGASYSGGQRPAYPPADSVRDEVGFLFRLGPARLRLELPLPTADASSHHDIVELTR